MIDDMKMLFGPAIFTNDNVIRTMSSHSSIDVLQLISKLLPAAEFNAIVSCVAGTTIGKMIEGLAKLDNGCKALLTQPGEATWRASKSCSSCVCDATGTSVVELIPHLTNKKDDPFGGLTNFALSTRVVAPSRNTCGHEVNIQRVDVTSQPWTWISTVNKTGPFMVEIEAAAGTEIVGAIIWKANHFTYQKKVGQNWIVYDDDKAPTQCAHPSVWDSIKAIITRRLCPEDGGGSNHAHTVATINVRTFNYRDKEQILQELNGRQGADIIAISEYGSPDLQTVQRLQSDGWNVTECLRWPRNTDGSSNQDNPHGAHRGGAALLVRKSKYDVRSVVLVMTHERCQMAAVEVRAKDHKNGDWETFAAIYVPPPEADSEEPPLEEFIQELFSASRNVTAIMGDFNARDEKWDKLRKDEGRNWVRGRKLARIFDEWDLNPYSKPSYPRCTGTITSIDLIVAAGHVDSSTLKTVTFDTRLTDHYAVVAQLGQPPMLSISSTRKLTWNWTRLKIASPEEQRIFSLILDEIIGVCGVGAMQTGDRCNLIQDAVFSALKRCGAVQEWRKHQKAKCNTTPSPAAMLSTGKKSCWEIVKELKRSENQPPPSTLRSKTDDTQRSGKEQANWFATQFADTHRLRPRTAVDNLPPLTQPSVIASPIHLAPGLVQMVLSNQRSDAGRDGEGLSPEILKACANSIRFVNALTRLFEDTASTGEGPNYWKELRVIPVCKREKSRCFIENYRAIFVAPWLSRIGEAVFNLYERAALARVPITWSHHATPWVASGSNASHHGFSTAQVGGRAGLGDTTISLATAEMLAIAVEKDEMLFQACLDLDGAFPHVFEPDAIQEMQLAGSFPPSVAFANAISGRCRFKAIAGIHESDAVNVESGSKAGRPGEPIKWSLYTRPILQLLNDAVTEATRKGSLGYGITLGFACAAADDISILAVSNSDGIGILEQKLNAAFKKLVDRYSIEISPKSTIAVHNVQAYCNKTKPVILTSSSVKSRFETMSFAGIRINTTFKGAIKNLGVTWSTGTHDVFGDHAETLIAKHRSGMRMLSPFTSKLPLPLLIQMYHAHCLGPWIHSMPVIVGLMQNKTIDRLDQEHAQGLKQLAFIPKSAHNMASIYECGSRSFVCLALGRVSTLREQLVRVTQQTAQLGQPIITAEFALKYLDRTYKKFALTTPNAPSREPVILDAPHIDVGLMHLFLRIEFHTDHDMQKEQRDALASSNIPEVINKIKFEANAKRLETLRGYGPATWGYADGSVQMNQSGHRKAATAANLYDDDDLRPTMQSKLAAPNNSCSYTAESRTLGAICRMAAAHEAPVSTRALIIVLDSLSKIKQVEKGPIRNKDARTAEDINALLNLLATRYTKIVIAHLYSHTGIDERMETVDLDAKEAAANARRDHSEDADHWWRDDARQTLMPVLKARQEQLLQGCGRGKHGPNSPTVWNKTTSGLTHAQLRRLAQIRVFCCSGLGGHLHGVAHCVTCGLCGKECGRAISDREKIQSPIEHLFTCERLQALRTTTQMKHISAMWKEPPKHVLEFINEATALSRKGPYRRAETTLGAHWAEDEQ